MTKQHTPEYCINSYWAYRMILNTNDPDKDWYKFRDLFPEMEVMDIALGS